MKKVLFIAPKFPFGGAERQMLELSKLGIKKGLDIKILDFESRYKKKVDVVDVLPGNSKILYENKKRILRPLLRVKSILDLKKIIETTDYDYYIFFNKLFLPVTLLINKEKKMIFSIREYQKKYFSFLYRLMLNRLEFITTNNLSSLVELRAFGYKSYLINNISFNRKDRIESIFFKRNKKILVVSNIARHKNIHSSILALNKLKNKGFELRIAGKVVDDDYKEELENLKGGNTIFLGMLDKKSLEDEYKNAQIVLHMSKNEGTANAILDAVKYGKPFICLDIPENIVISELNQMVLLSDDSIESINSKILSVDKKMEEDSLELREYLLFLQNKIKLNYSENNGDIFFELLGEKEKKLDVK